MSDNPELHGKILGFLAAEFARAEGRQCVGVDLVYSPGQGFRDEEIRKWVRADQPELFDLPNNLVHVERFVVQIIEIAEGEVEAKPPGKHRFVVRTHQHLGGRAVCSFALLPSFKGSDDNTALMAPGGGAGRGDSNVIANHAGQLMRINAQMFEGTIRVLGAQNSALHEQVTQLTSETAILRKELEEARSNKMDREFQIAMAAEKNARTNAGFQKLLQIGSVVAAKIGAGEEGAAAGGGVPNGLAILIGDFGKSLRQEQIGVLMNTLDMSQKIMFMEIMNAVTPKEAPPNQPGQASPSS